MSTSLKDIRTYIPMDNTTRFCLDTNVLYWYTYPRYMEQEHAGTMHRAQYYYDFVDRLVANGNPLFTTRYNITELINIIEKHEYDIFCALNRDADYSKKDFRRMEDQREGLKRVLKTTLSNVNNICNTLDFSFNKEIMDNYIDTLTEHRCDVFDFAILSYCKENNFLNIITDDNDFTSIDGIKIYTANEVSLNQ